MFCVLERCIEVVGARRAGEKNRRPTSYYDVQSCAMEQWGALFCKYSSSEKKMRGSLSDFQRRDDSAGFLWLFQTDRSTDCRCHVVFDTIENFKNK